MHVNVVKNPQRKTIEKLLRKMVRDGKNAPISEPPKPYRSPRPRQPVGATFHVSSSEVESIKDADKIAVELDIYKNLMKVKAFKTAFRTARNNVGLSIKETKKGIIATIRRYMRTGRECTSTVEKGHEQSFKAFASKVGKAMIAMGRRSEPEIIAALIAKKA